MIATRWLQSGLTRVVQPSGAWAALRKSELDGFGIDLMEKRPLRKEYGFHVELTPDFGSNWGAILHPPLVPFFSQPALERPVRGAARRAGGKRL